MYLFHILLPKAPFKNDNKKLMKTHKYEENEKIEQAVE